MAVPVRVDPYEACSYCGSSSGGVVPGSPLQQRTDGFLVIEIEHREKTCPGFTTSNSTSIHVDIVPAGFKHAMAVQVTRSPSAIVPRYMGSKVRMTRYLMACMVRGPMVLFPVSRWGLVRDSLKWFRPDLDVALPGNLIESQTQAAPPCRVFGPSFPFLSFVQDNVTTQEEDPHGF